MCVKIGDILSDKKIINSGVPQGSVLGPILFLIFFESILRINFRGHCVAFADDLAITFCNNHRFEVENDMNCDLLLIRSWFDTNQLLLSSKSKCLFFDLIKPTRSSHIVYHKGNCSDVNCNENECIEIAQVDEYKYLGIVLDRRLSFKNHSESLTSELRKSRYFYLLRDMCPKEILKNLYFSLIYSRIQYGISCWGGSYNYNIDSLVKIQKYFIRIMCFKNLQTPSYPLFQQIKILPLRYLYVYKVLSVFFANTSSVALRNGSRCLIPLPNKEQFRRYQLFVAPNIFNKLPNEIKNLPKLKTFCVELKKGLLSRESVFSLFTAIGN